MHSKHSNKFPPNSCWLNQQTHGSSSSIFESSSSSDCAPGRRISSDLLTIVAHINCCPFAPNVPVSSRKNPKSKGSPSLKQCVLVNPSSVNGSAASHSDSNSPLLSFR